MRKAETSQEVLRRQVFILRRATWVGRCKVADITEAFGIVPQVASRDLIRAAKTWTIEGRAVLAHQRGEVIRLLGQPEHPQAGPLVMLELLRRSAPFQESGLREHECLTLQQPLQGVQASSQESLSAILRSLVRLGAVSGRPIQRTLEIDYVGLKVGDTLRTRWIAPVGLEFDGGQVRLWAHDLQASGYPLKSFVISRIAAARLSARPMPADFSPDLALPRESVTLQAVFDERLTQDQCAAFARELNLDERGQTRVARHRVFHVQRLYAQSGFSSEAIWPPLLSLKEVREA